MDPWGVPVPVPVPVPGATQATVTLPPAFESGSSVSLDRERKGKGSSLALAALELAEREKERLATAAATTAATASPDTTRGLDVGSRLVRMASLDRDGIGYRDDGDDVAGRQGGGQGMDDDGGFFESGYSESQTYRNGSGPFSSVVPRQQIQGFEGSRDRTRGSSPLASNDIDVAIRRGAIAGGRGASRAGRARGGIEVVVRRHFADHPTMIYVGVVDGAGAGDAKTVSMVSSFLPDVLEGEMRRLGLQRCSEEVIKGALGHAVEQVRGRGVSGEGVQVLVGLVAHDRAYVARVGRGRVCAGE